jgi:hypothetical protein
VLVRLLAGPFLLPSDWTLRLPTLDTMSEEDISLPPVVHGPVLIAMAR